MELTAEQSGGQPMCVVGRNMLMGVELGWPPTVGTRGGRLSDSPAAISTGELAYNDNAHARISRNATACFPTVNLLNPETPQPNPSKIVDEDGLFRNLSQALNYSTL